MADAGLSVCDIARPRPPAPAPLVKAAGALGIFLGLRRSPIAGFTRACYEQPIFTIKTFLGPIVVVSSAKSLRHVLIDNCANYRRERIQRTMLEVALGTGLLTAEDEQWRLQRRAAASFFTPKRIAGLAHPMAEAAQRMIERWSALPGATRIDLEVELRRTMIDVLETTLFTDGIGDQRDGFPDALAHYFDTVGKIGVLDALNLPRWLPRLGRWRARDSLELFSAMADAVIGARRERLAGSKAAPDDLLTTLLQFRDPGTGLTLSANEVKDNIITFASAGSETTASTLAWAIYLLALDAEWSARLHEEADRELPDGHHVEGSLERLVATKAVLEETMRLYPLVPVTTRQAIGCDRLDGQDIARGTVVIIAPWLIHRHRLLWDRPDLFDPARFVPPARAAIDRFAYLPFGYGPRICIGASFAMQEMTIMLAAIMRHFRFELAPGHSVWPQNRVILRPQGGLPMILHRRLSRLGVAHEKSS